MSNKSGIYQILNIVNGKRYIGSAVDIKGRWAAHSSDLLYGKHRNKHLQRSYNKYGKKNFTFSVVEYVEVLEDLIDREQYYMDRYDWGMLYNLNPTAGSCLGIKRSDEMKEKLRKFHTGRKHTEESKKKMSESTSGKNNPMYGKPCSAERKKNISDALSAPITFKGKTQGLIAWAKEYGLKESTLRERLNKYKWSLEKALTTPVKKSFITFNGKTQSVKDWAEEVGIHRATLHSRLTEYGWSIEKALTEPVINGRRKREK